MWGDGRGGFVPATLIPAFAQNVRELDLDGDGHLDLAGLANESFLPILFGDGHGGFTKGPETSLTNGCCPSTFEAPAWTATAEPTSCSTACRS